MKLTQYLAALCLPLFALTACETDRDMVIFDSTTATPATLSINGTAQELYTLDASNASANVLTLSWTQPEINIQAPITNVLQMGLDGYGYNDTDPLATITERTMTTYDVVASTLNGNIQTILGKYDMETPTTPDEALTINFRMASFITGSASDTIFSEVLSIKVLPYEGEAIYPKMFLIGAYCGWSGTNANTQSLSSFNNDNVNFEGVIDFGTEAANGFKITDVAPNGDWSNCKYNCGIDNAAGAPAAEASSITLLNNGSSGNISCYSHRFYRFQFNKTELKLSMNLSFDALYLVGSANGLTWDTSKPENQMNFDPEHQRFYIDYALNANDEIKVLTDNGTWFGGTTDGGLNTQDNIKVPAAGNYRIYVNLNNSANMTYELNAEDYGAE